MEQEVHPARGESTRTLASDRAAHLLEVAPVGEAPLERGLADLLATDISSIR